MREWLRAAKARIPRWLGTALGVCFIALAVLTWRWILSPDTSSVDSLERADAVVLFVGGRGERLETALEVMDTTGTPVLVIPNGLSPTWPDANELCQNATEFEVVCLAPDPDSTRGEARLIAELAEDRGWSLVIMVTSTYHVSRAELMLSRCFPGTITAVDASPEISAAGWTRHVAHEWLGHLKSRVLERAC